MDQTKGKIANSSKVQVWSCPWSPSEFKTTSLFLIDHSLQSELGIIDVMRDNLVLLPIVGDILYGWDHMESHTHTHTHTHIQTRHVIAASFLPPETGPGSGYRA